MLEVQEDGTAAHEGFKVAGDGGGKKGVELAQELALAADSFKEGLGFLRRNFFNGRDNELFVAGPFCAWRFGNVRMDDFAQRIHRVRNVAADFVERLGFGGFSFLRHAGIN